MTSDGWLATYTTMQWHGIAFYAWLWCAPADAVLLEHSRSKVPELLGIDVQVVSPYMLPGGGIERKETHVALRNLPQLATLPPEDWPPHASTQDAVQEP